MHGFGCAEVALVPANIQTIFLTCLFAAAAVCGCGKKDKKKSDEAPESVIAPADANGNTENAKDTLQTPESPTVSAAVYKPEITLEGVLHTSYYNRATSTPYFQSSTELKDLFPDISNPKTSQLCLPTIMSYELYTQLAAKPSLTNPQSESYLSRPVTDQVREMYRVCETDRFRGTTAPQAANCAVQAASATGLKSQVHVIGTDAKWKDFGYYIASVTTDNRTLAHKDIIDGIANKASMMFLIGFYETMDGVNFERKGGHFISVTATGIADNDKTSLKIWIVDPANPGQEKPQGSNPFNGTLKAIVRPADTNLDPLITNELVGSKIESAGYRIFLESAIRYSLSAE
jgi:hypothetical protein